MTERLNDLITVLNQQCEELLALTWDEKEAVWETLVQAGYRPDNTGWPWMRRAVVKLAIAWQLPLEKAMPLIDAAPVVEESLAWASHNFTMAGCVHCTSDPRPHLGCYGFLCLCECAGEDV